MQSKNMLYSLSCPVSVHVGAIVVLSGSQCLSDIGAGLRHQTFLMNIVLAAANRLHTEKRFKIVKL